MFSRSRTYRAWLGADALAASGLDAFASRYADRANGGWFSGVAPSGQLTDFTKTSYAHAHVLRAAASAVAAGLPGAGGAHSLTAPALAQAGLLGGGPGGREIGDEPAEPPWLQAGEDTPAQVRAGRS